MRKTLARQKSVCFDLSDKLCSRWVEISAVNVLLKFIYLFCVVTHLKDMDTQRGKKRPFFKWTEDKMSLAIDAVKNEGMSKKCAAKEFCVPRTTLKRRLENNCLKRKMGPKTILSEGEEKLLANGSCLWAERAFLLMQQIYSPRCIKL
uniref:Uncharacterized protein LOC114326718 n=1 Tax=Diabrotica virgifera virgifera TaxID=50390 RepID=A0A6P7FBS3_DIAVI